MDKKEKERRAKLCKKCYSCETDVDKSITVDDMKEEKQRELSKEEKAKLCKKCYTCEMDVDKSITVDDMRKQEQKELSKEEKAKLCKKCYTCQQNVSLDVTVDSLKKEEQVGVQPPQKDRASLCKQCYFCQQGVSKDVTVDSLKKQGVGQSQTMPFVYYIFPSGNCNLSCKYPCYASNKVGNMTKETRDVVLNWLFKRQPYKNITCHFFGGEPTLQWDTLTNIVEIGNVMAESGGYKVTWSMTTNGTLLNDERLDWISKHFRSGNPFLLSLDGRPKTHDKYRVLPGGKPTFHLIPVDKIIKIFPNIEVRPTIMPDTAKDWFEDFCFLRNKGFKAIAIEPNFEIEWSRGHLQDYEDMLLKLGKFYIYSQKQGTPVYMKFIDGVKGCLEGGTPQGRMCGVAYNCGAIDFRGKLYACQRYASYNDPEKYALGDVWNGWDEFKLMETQALFRENVQGEVAKGYNCRTCSIVWACFRGCNACNSKWMGTRYITPAQYCELTKVEVRVALSVLAEIGVLGLKKQS